MSQLAATVLDLFFELSFASEDYVEFDWGLRRCSDILSDIKNNYSDEEKSAIQLAAANKLKYLLREPDEHGYTPRKLVTAEQKAFLEAVAAGRFDGAPEE